MIGRTKELLAGDPPDVSKLSPLKLSLNEKLEVLKQLDDDILAMVDEEEVSGEIEQCDEFKESVYAAIVGVERAVALPSSTPTLPPPRVEPEPSSVSSKVKLPRLTLQPFDGELTTWTPFWDSFKAAVHDNRALSDIDKFNYLRGLLQRTALEAISGLSLTAANYLEAVAILEKRFGNKPQIVAKHMDVLIHVDAVTSTHNVKGLRRLYDLVESNVRSLRSLGVESASYGSLLASVLITKIPQELQLIVSRKMGSDDWNLDTLMAILGEELQARERMAVGSAPSVKKISKEPATAAALLTGGSNRITCSYCQQDHTSNSCRVVPQPHARKQVLQKAGRCFVCLRRGHISRECNSPRRCAKCGGRHHVSICLRGTDPPPPRRDLPVSDQLKTDNPIADSTRSRPDPPAAQRSGLNAGAPTFQSQEPRSTTTLWVNSGRTVLLQTAQSRAFNPDSPHQSRRVRIVLDSGSQRSYVTEHVARELSLTPEGKQPMTIMTFGTSEEQPQVCDRVRLSLALKNGRTRQLKLFTVPIICEPLSCQPVSVCQDSFDHLMGLDLADPSDGRSRLDIDILVGSDQYWDLTTGETRRGRSGPVAINTELGWVLSGPAACTSPDQNQPFTSLTTHTLRVDGLPLAVQALDDRLKSFWDLESFGISPYSDTDPSVNETFESSICFVDGRYQVKLPWKESHPPLADHYNLCVKRLRGLIRRLRQDPDVLREYDSTVKDQIQRGVVEPVEEASGELCHKIHYLPHHAIIRKDRETTKIRVVYDASARSEGPSLNDCLHAGPKFDQRILDILLRFRVHRVAVTADIEKAFLMVGIAKEDRDVLRFLWFDDVYADQPNLAQLRFTRVVFGVTSSPFLLNATIRHHLERYREVQPRLVEKLSKAAYVDDIVTGADNEEDALQLFTTSKEILKEGGFHLRKFCSNSTLLQMKVECQETLDKSAPDETYTSTTLGSGQPVRSGERKVLGVRWDLATDQLVMSLEDIASAASDIEPTKRAIVSLVGKIYDPLGLLSPIVIQLKIFIQELCEAKLEWDRQLTGQPLDRWHHLSSKLHQAGPFLNPRCYMHGIQEQAISYRLCGFCDASLKAYAAVVYLLVETPSERHVRSPLPKPGFRL